MTDDELFVADLKSRIDAGMFDVIKDEESLKLRCRYCEKTTLREDAVFL